MFAAFEKGYWNSSNFQWIENKDCVNFDRSDWNKFYGFQYILVGKREKFGEFKNAIYLDFILISKHLVNLNISLYYIGIFRNVNIENSNNIQWQNKRYIKRDLICKFSICQT